MTLVDLDLFNGKITHGKIVEHKISWKVLKIFAKNCYNDDLGLTLTFLFAFRAFIWGEFMAFMENFGAKANKHS